MGNLNNRPNEQDESRETVEMDAKMVKKYLAACEANEGQFEITEENDGGFTIRSISEDTSAAAFTELFKKANL